MVPGRAPGRDLRLDTRKSNAEALVTLRENGIVIWLTADPEIIQARLARDQNGETQRPSLTGADTIREVAAVLAQRAPLYEAAAHFIIDTNHRNIHQVVDAVLAALKSQETTNLGG